VPSLFDVKFLFVKFFFPHCPLFHFHTCVPFPFFLIYSFSLFSLFSHTAHLSITLLQSILQSIFFFFFFFFSYPQIPLFSFFIVWVFLLKFNSHMPLRSMPCHPRKILRHCIKSLKRLAAIFPHFNKGPYSCTRHQNLWVTWPEVSMVCGCCVLTKIPKFNSFSFFLFKE